MTFIVIIVLKGILVDDAEGKVKKCHQMSQTGWQANSHRKQQSKRKCRVLGSEGLEASV